MKKHLICQSSQFTLFVYIKKVSHLPLQLGIFVFTFTVKRFHIYGALLHLALKVSTFTGPYYIFTFRGATVVTLCFFCLVFAMHLYASVYMCLVVTCWERADLSALVCGVEL